MERFTIVFNNDMGDNIGIGVVEGRPAAEEIKAALDKAFGHSPHHNVFQIAWHQRSVRVKCALCSETFVYKRSGIVDPNPIVIESCPCCNEDWFMTEKKIGETSLHFVQNVRWSLPIDPKFYLYAE